MISLTNSMSFGMLYISRIDGCIHDGWLVIRQDNEVFYPGLLLSVILLFCLYAILREGKWRSC